MDIISLGGCDPFPTALNPVDCNLLYEDAQWIDVFISIKIKHRMT